MLIILKFICLFLGVAYGFSNTIKAIKNIDIGSEQIILMSLGIVGFIFLQFKLY